MKRRTRSMVALVVAVTLISISTPIRAQEPPTAEELEVLTKRMSEAGQPGPEHERLAALAGVWDVEMKIWPQPDAEPIVAAGRMQSEMILGGRFLRQQVAIESGPFAGEALSFLGFDRRSSEFTVVGMDTSGTYWVTAKGPVGDDSARLVLSGTDFDAIFGADQVYDFVWTFVDADTVVTEVVFKDPMHTYGHSEFRMVQNTARRRQ